MWLPLLVMAVAVSLEPFRIGMTVVMMNRPRPALQLVAFLAGGFTMGISVGLVILFVLRPAMDSPHVSAPKIQIAVGAVLLLNAALLAFGRVRTPRDDENPLWTHRLWQTIVRRARQMLDGRSLWVAGLAGLGIALPSVDYLAALALIVASNAAAGVQVGALVLFNLVAFALVEIPLLSYLFAPERTQALLSALHNWMRAQGRRGVALMLAVVGCVLLGAGVIAL
ncbi:Sulfolipid-1 exporter Sap [Mycolicibacterium vanbaalenii]|uniref:Sulfolipid-1 exporter Sap n=1 Tax=Mycolicibacterium vanbaalenii TaxID=110539 RepID=A0A5S9PIT5_MYCVN|nr:GAP family protein [Mycolicibacterium vanbaalenii]CAA0103634.1 Sulfolipid-1 exporter Sap [Mycolicibacterium vanbaalenii]